MLSRERVMTGISSHRNAATHSLAVTHGCLNREFTLGHIYRRTITAKWNPRFTEMATIIRSRKNDMDRNNLFANA